MEFKIFYHDIFEKHLVPIGHPERPDRIINLNKLIKNLFPNQIQKIKSQKVIKNILKGDEIQSLKILKQGGRETLFLMMLWQCWVLAHERLEVLYNLH